MSRLKALREGYHRLMFKVWCAMYLPPQGRD